MESHEQYCPNKAEQYILKAFDESALPSLIEYIKIPNLSRQYDSQWNQNGLLLKAAEHITSWIQSIQVDGLKIEIIKEQLYSPLIYIEIAGDLPQTIMYYGHYDKQPPFTGWWEGFGPTTPIIKEQKLYGRGGADDGYSAYGTILSIKSLQLQGIPIPRCVVLIQGDEESGSAHLFYYIEKLKQRIGNPVIFFCLDSGTLDYQRFWLTRSLRGNLTAIIDVQVLTEGVHSGEASGIVPSSFRILRDLLDRIEDAKTGEVNQIFQVNIPPNRYQQTFNLANDLGPKLLNAYPFIGKTQPMTTDPIKAIINKSWKAQLSVTGASGLPDVEMAGNVLLPKLSIKISLRLPPTLDSNIAINNLQKLLTQNVPYNAKVSLRGLRAAKGWNAPQVQPFLQKSIKQASILFYKKPQLNIGEGGSIPLMGQLTEIWPQGQFLITGVLGPHSNAHGPNQFLHLPYVKKLICCMSYILAKTSKHFRRLK